MGRITQSLSRSEEWCIADGDRVGLRTEALFVGIANSQRKTESLSNEKKERIVKLLMPKDIAVFEIFVGARQVADPVVRLHRESSGRHWSWNASAAINAGLTRPPSRPPTPKAVRAGGRVSGHISVLKSVNSRFY